MEIKTSQEIWTEWREVIDYLAAFKMGELSVEERAPLTTQALELAHAYRRTPGNCGNIVFHTLG